MKFGRNRFLAVFDRDPIWLCRVDPPGTGTVPPPATTDPTALLAAANAKIAELEAAAAKKAAPPADDPDLIKKAQDARAASDKTAADTKALENALMFSLKSEDFLKTNESLLPKGVVDIFTQAGKENYSNAVEKDQAIKSGIVQSFFSVQANVDLLTPSQKSSLDDYLKLTKTVKQERAQQMYDSVFEPTFEMLKRLKKAEALSKGYGGDSDSEAAYKNRLMTLSRKHHLGDSKNA